MRVLRDWLVWAATWTLVVASPMWVGVAVDAWQERTDPTLDASPVPGWVPSLAYVAAPALALGLLLVVLGRATRWGRGGLVLGAVGLATGAVAFTGFPDGDTGEWYVALSALAAGCALVGAVLPARPGEVRPAGWQAWLPGLALVAAAAFTAWTCWQGASYWHWDAGSTSAYLLGLVGAAALAGLGVAAPLWAEVGSRLLRWTLTALAGLGTLWLLAGASMFFGDYGVLFRWEEDEVAWNLGTPLMLLGAGLLAAGVAAWRRRGDLVGWSLAAGPSFCLLALWQDSTWGSVMR
ncbi:hypothetical protein F4692_003699 [Nocardioides cavernae]|uniref:Uncharacterized protein n=1 Tax=Nocardioides cavernae TaxID=1921566 RepID=A0A7Y9KTE1_9ACTN|nr:hypothetical protein [Nocardioides cavernae]NYE38549.1 hypothetical protein [Nocardioides cavernae]